MIIYIYIIPFHYLIEEVIKEFFIVRTRKKQYYPLTLCIVCISKPQICPPLYTHKLGFECGKNSNPPTQVMTHVYLVFVFKFKSVAVHPS